MNEYIFDIKQTLLKTVKIKSVSEVNATKIIQNMVDDGEIRLTVDDCIESEVKLIKSKEENQPTLFD